MKEATLASGMRVWSAQPEGPGPFPTAFILHERYGPVQHTFNIMERMAREGFAAFAPDLFHRYTGNRQAVEDAEERVELPDEHTLTDIDELMGHIRGLDYADDARVVIAGYCQTGRTPLVVASHRGYVSGALVLHGGIYPRDYAATETGEESVVGLTPRLSCPVFGAFGELDELIPLPNIWTFRQMLEEHGQELRHPRLQRRPSLLDEHHDPQSLRAVPGRADRGRLAGHARLLQRGRVRGVGPRATGLPLQFEHSAGPGILALMLESPALAGVAEIPLN